MTSVGVRELRQRASELLRLVEHGETIEITDRGRPVARIVPERIDESVAELILQGKATWSGRPFTAPRRVPTPRRGPLFSDYIDEDRR